MSGLGEAQPDVTNEHITEAREMRKQLNAFARLGHLGAGRPDRGPTICASIVRNCQSMAEYAGLSGEDLYTVTLWHLLHHAMRMEKVVFDRAMTEVSTRMFIRTPGLCAHADTQAIDPAHNNGGILRCVDCGARRKPGSEWSRP